MVAVPAVRESAVRSRGIVLAVAVDHLERDEIGLRLAIARPTCQPDAGEPGSYLLALKKRYLMSAAAPSSKTMTVRIQRIPMPHIIPPCIIPGPIGGPGGGGWVS
jgi:hypothetical protein